MNYISGDIRDLRNTINILDLEFADQSVDVLFACHVVNMVPDDKKALAEVFRVLKPGGVGILPVPIHTNVSKTIEAGPNSTLEERLQLFGDAMMFRKYSGEDYLNRLSDANFEARTIRPDDINEFEVESWRLCHEWLQIGVRDASSQVRGSGP